MRRLTLITLLASVGAVGACTKFPELPADAADAPVSDATLADGHALDARETARDASPDAPPGVPDAAVADARLDLPDAMLMDAGCASVGCAGGLTWARRALKAATSVQSASVAVDGSDNIFVTGTFQGTAIFGVDQAVLVPAGFPDIFIARFDRDGRFVWAKRAGGNDSDQAESIAVASDGSVVIAGSFRGTSTFGPGEPLKSELTSSGDDDIFVAKIGAGGSLIWAKRAGGVSYDAASGVAASPDGGVLVTGSFRGSAVFGAGETTEATLTATGDNDIFVAKYSGDGALIWVKRAGSWTNTFCDGAAVRVFPSAEVAVVGSCNGKLTLDPGGASEVTLPFSGQSDIFVAKYTATGSVAWAAQAGGGDGDYALAVAVDGSDVLVAGTFTTAAVFGQGQPGETTLTSVGANAFVARYGATGSLAWANHAHGMSTEFRRGSGVTATADGNLVITGDFQGDLIFGVAEATVSAVGGTDVFVAKYAGNGALIWAGSAGGSSQDLGNGVAGISGGGVVVTGDFTYTALFGAGEVNETTITNNGTNSGGFLATYRQ